MADTPNPNERRYGERFGDSGEDLATFYRVRAPGDTEKSEESLDERSDNP